MRPMESRAVLGQEQEGKPLRSAPKATAESSIHGLRWLGFCCGFCHESRPTGHLQLPLEMGIFLLKYSVAREWTLIFLEGLGGPPGSVDQEIGGGLVVK